MNYADTVKSALGKVSIIIPCYNQAKYLPEAIESALTQTYKNIEIIVVDDGSTDNTFHVAARYNDVKVVRQPNKGLSGARNAGIKNSTGSWILPLDADDRILPEYITKTIGLADFVSTDIQEFGDSQIIRQLGEDFSVNAFKIANRAVCCSLYRREIWRILGGYDENMKLGYEDWDFHFRVAKAGFTFKRVKEPLFLYRKHGKSLDNSALGHYSEILEYMLNK